MSGIIQCVAFCVWLPFLSVTLPMRLPCRSVYRRCISVYGRIKCHAWMTGIGQMPFIPSSTGGCLDCFCLIFCIINTLAMNIHIQIFTGTYVFSSPRNEMRGHIVTLFNFWGTAELSSPQQPLCITTSRAWGLQPLHTLASTCYFHRAVLFLFPHF